MNDRLSAEEIKAIRFVIDTIAEVIYNLGTVLSGELYARVMGHLTLQQYDAVIDLLIEQGRVRRKNHLLTWIGKERP